MILILILLLALYRMPVTVFSFQSLYYFFALAVFSLGLSWFISAVQVFYRDMAQILTVMLQAWFWMTPVVWFSEMIPEKYLFFVRLNPMYYIIEGYRHSFVYPEPFWQESGLSLYFWAVCLSLFFFGSRVFARLKPEFAEVL
jgi:lipopolysaccharide transport system permease protein/teichoic acid transport system permease protein